MIEAGILLLICQLVGESIVRAIDIPVPGPVLGAVFMLGVAGLMILTLFGVDTGLFRR